MTVHDLRRSYASLAYHLQIPEMIAAEIGGWFAIGCQCGFAYVMALITRNLGRLFVGVASAAGLIIALGLLAVLCRRLFKPFKEAQKLTVTSR